MMVDQEHLREIKQLWCVGCLYLERAHELKEETRSYRDVFSKFKDRHPGEKDFKTLWLSAELDSAAARFFSLEESLRKTLCKDARQAWKPEEFMHVYLRMASSHAESETVTSEKEKEFREELSKLPINESLEYMGKIRDRLRESIEKDPQLKTWMESESEGWVKKLRDAARRVFYPSP